MTPEQIMALVSEEMPELYSVYEAMKTSRVPGEVLCDFMCEVQIVRTRGWGSVVADIQRHQLTRIEGRSQKLYAIPKYEPKEQQNRYAA